MKGEITCTKRHLKGHRSKLSFSRSGRPTGHISTFPTFHCVPALHPVLWQTIRLLIASIHKFGGKSGNYGWALISLAIRAHFLKSPKRLPRFCHQGQEGGKEEETSQREFSRRQKRERGCTVAGNGKHPSLLSCPSTCDLAKSPRNLHPIFWPSLS